MNFSFLVTRCAGRLALHPSGACIASPLISSPESTPPNTTQPNFRLLSGTSLSPARGRGPTLSRSEPLCWSSAKGGGKPKATRVHNFPPCRSTPTPQAAPRALRPGTGLNCSAANSNSPLWSSLTASRPSAPASRSAPGGASCSPPVLAANCGGKKPRSGNLVCRLYAPKTRRCGARASPASRRGPSRPNGWAPPIVTGSEIAWLRHKCL